MEHNEEMEKEKTAPQEFSARFARRIVGMYEHAANLVEAEDGVKDIKERRIRVMV